MEDDKLHRIEQLAEAYLAQQRGGNPSSIDDFVAQHSQHAEELRDFIEALQLVNDLKRSSPIADSSKTAPFPQIDDYRIVRELGRGAMGVVYEAEQLSLSRRVALKTMLGMADHSPRERQRFQHEARTAAKLHHPRIVPVYDVGESNGSMFYAMQYIEGRGLDRVTRSVGKLISERTQPGTSVEEGLAQLLVTGTSSTQQPARQNNEAAPSPRSRTVKRTASADSGSSLWRRRTDNYRNYCQSVGQIGHHVADALAFAHEQGVIHRDIKPANLLLDLSGDVWVADFGLVKTNDSELTQTGAFVGTLRYMAPERFQGDCDARSDIYSLGVTLYELLALRPALQSTDQLSLLNQIRDTDPTPLRAIERRIPRDLEVIIARAMQKEPNRRYATARQLADDLDHFLHGRPIQAREVSRMERLAIWARRNPVVASLLSLLVAGLFATLLGSMYAAVAFRDIAEVAKQSATAANEATETTAATLARSNYFLAWARWEENQARAAHNFLDGIPERFRNIEWGLAKRHFQGGYKTLAAGTNTARCLCLTPDGSKLIVAGGDAIVVRDAYSGHELMRRKAPSDGVDRIYASPGGQLLASVSKDKFRVWDINSLDKVWDSGKNKIAVKQLAFSPHGKSIVAVNEEGDVTLYDMKTGQPQWQSSGNGEDANDVGFHPHGNIVVSAGDDRTIRFWDARTGTLLHAIKTRGYSEPLSGLYSVAFHPTGELLAVGSLNGNVYLYSVEFSKTPEATPQIVTQEAGVLRGHTTPVLDLAFFPDGARLATSGSDTTVRIWNVNSKTEDRRLRGHFDRVASIALAADGHRLYSADGNTTKFWDARRMSDRTTYREHSGRVNSVRFSSTGNELLSASNEQIRLWDSRSLATAGSYKWVERRTNLAIFSPDDRWIAAASLSGKVQLWDRNSGKVLGSYTQSKDVEDMDFSLDGSLLAIAGADAAQVLKCRPFRVAPGQTNAPQGQIQMSLAHLFDGHDNDVTSIIMSPDANQVVTGGRDGAIIYWDNHSGAQIRKATTSHASRVADLTISADGSKLFSGSVRAKIWSLTTGDLIAELAGHTALIYSLDITPDGSRIATASGDKTIRIWDADTGEQLCRFDQLPSLREVRFSPNGLRIAAAHRNGVSIWDADVSVDAKNANTAAKPLTVDPSWHAFRAEIARQQGDWFAAVVHRSREFVANPQSLNGQLALWVAARRLQATSPQHARYLPKFTQKIDIVALALAGKRLSMTNRLGEALSQRLMKRLLDRRDSTLVPEEIELQQASCETIPNQLSLRTMAFIYYKQGDYRKAVETLETQPDRDAVDFQLLALCHLQMGDQELAQELHNKARVAVRELDDQLIYKAFRRLSNRLFDEQTSENEP